LPDDLNITLQQMSQLRNTLSGDFAYKVKELNKVTAMLVENHNKKSFSMHFSKKLWLVCFAGFGFLVFLFITNY
jgi:hypothetical protein